MRYDRYPMDERMDYADYNRNSRSDYANGPMHFGYDRRYDGNEMYESDMRRRSSTTGRYMRDRYMTGEEKLPEEDVERWTKSLLGELEERDRQILKMDTILKRTQDMGISFEKFTPEEFYVTVVMLYTDFSKALPAQPIDTYIKMAKAWLCDPDASKRYGKKLAAYYEEIVNGD